MKIAICASEASPYAKSGGLGDVMEALPRALARMPGNEVTLFLPYYNKIKTNTAYEVEKVAQFRVQMGWRQQFAGLMKLVTAPGGVTVYFIDNDYYFGGRTGAIYGDMDDGERFAYFSKACLDALVALDNAPEARFADRHSKGWFVYGTSQTGCRGGRERLGQELAGRGAGARV